MKSLSKNRVAAFGAAGALALGTVASLGAFNPAGAATTNYDCTLPVAGVASFPIKTPSPLPAEMLPGEVVAAHSVPLSVGLPEATVGLLKLLGYSSVSGTVSDTAYAVGSGTPTALPLTGLAAAEKTLPASGGMKLPLTGTAGEYTAPMTLGAVPVSLPGSFTFIPATAGGPIASVPCALGAGSSPSLGASHVVSKYSSKTTAKLKNAPIARTEHAKIATKVLNGNGAAAAGKVVAKEGTKTLAKGTLSGKGKKTLSLSLLKKGVHKVVVKYAGNSTTAASKKVVRFTVR